MKPLTRAGFVLGLGLAGFIDGIVLHQILGWHHLICTTETCQVETVAALKLQNTQDGFFHLAMWVLTIAGIGMLSRASRLSQLEPREHMWSAQRLFGAILAGAGAFNFVEGLINHQLLGIHHVRPGDPHQFLWDMLFLASGVALIAVGSVLTRSGTRASDSVHPDANYAA